MATEGKGSLEGKLGDLNLEEKAPAAEESETFEDAKDAPVEETPEEVQHSVLEELKEGVPELHHVETKDTTDPLGDEGSTPTEGVVKAEVPEAFEEELKSDHDIVSTKAPAPTSAVETVTEEVGAEDGKSAPATRETPVEVTHKNVDTPVKHSSIGEKISQTLHNLVGKDSS